MPSRFSKIFQHHDNTLPSSVKFFVEDTALVPHLYAHYGIHENTGFSHDGRLQSRTSILIVDDNEINRYILESILRRMGYQTVSANDGLEAINRLASDKNINLVLTDLKMPRLDGYKLTQYIKEKYSSTLPVIAISAEDPGETENKALSSGCDAFISKPYTGDQIKSAVKKYI